MSGVRIGDRVCLWARPNNKMILVFGAGVLEDSMFVNGTSCPVVRLDDGSEVVVHVPGVHVGGIASVEKSCQEFNGDVIAWRLDDYHNGKLPLPKEGVVGQVKSAAVSMQEQMQILRNRRASIVEMLDKTDKEIAALEAANTSQMLNAVASLDEKTLAALERAIEQRKAGVTAAPVVAVESPKSLPVEASSDEDEHTYALDD